MGIFKRQLRFEQACRMIILLWGKRSNLFIVIYVVISFPFCKIRNSLIPENAFISIKEKKKIQFEVSVLIITLKNLMFSVFFSKEHVRFLL